MANELEIVKDGSEADDADYYVCAKADGPAYFADDLFDFCCKCGEKVRFRPHGPTVPKKICFECALPDIQKEAEKGELTIAVTEQTAEEVRKHMKRN